MHKEPPKQIGGVDVVAISDYKAGIVTEDGKTQPTGLPSSNVLSYRLANRDLLFVRPSGTEPKIKVYYMLEAKDKAEAIEKCNCYQAEMERVFR